MSNNIGGNHHNNDSNGLSGGYAGYINQKIAVNNEIVVNNGSVGSSDTREGIENESTGGHIEGVSEQAKDSITVGGSIDGRGVHLQAQTSSEVITKIENTMGQLPVAQTKDYNDKDRNTGSTSSTHKDEGVLDLTGDLMKKEGVGNNIVGESGSGVGSMRLDLKDLQKGVELNDEELALQSELDEGLIGGSVADHTDDLVESVRENPQAGLQDEQEGQEEQVEDELTSEKSREGAVKEKSKIVDLEKYKKLQKELESVKKELGQAEKILHKLKQDSQRLSGNVNILGIGAGQADVLQSEIQEQEIKVDKLKQKIEEINSEINILWQQEQSSAVAQENVEINTEKEMPTEVVERRTEGAFIIDIQNAIKKISPDMESEEALDIANLVMSGFFDRVKEKFPYEGASQIFTESFRKFNGTIGGEFVVKFDEKRGFILEIPEIEEKLNAGNLAKVA